MRSLRNKQNSPKQSENRNPIAEDYEEMEESMENFNRRPMQADSINEIEDRPVKIIQSQEQRKNKGKQ